MKIKFCKKTEDISFRIFREEAINLKRKRDEFFTPVLDAKDKGLTFHLMNCSSKHYIQFIKPAFKSYNHRYVKINDIAYRDLIAGGKCGTRYENGPKINIIVEDSF